MARRLVELPIVEETTSDDNILVYNTTTQDLSRIAPINLVFPEGSNVQSDWNETNTNSVTYILNKPTTITQAQTDKLNGIQVGAEVNVQADWNETDITSDSYIAHKPIIPIPRTDSEIRNVTAAQLVGGNRIVITPVGNTLVIDYDPNA